MCRLPSSIWPYLQTLHVGHKQGWLGQSITLNPTLKVPCQNLDPDPYPQNLVEHDILGRLQTVDQSPVNPVTLPSSTLSQSGLSRTTLMPFKDSP